MALFTKDLETITNNITSQLVNNTDITNVEEGTTSKVLVDSISEELRDLYNSVDVNQKMSFLSTADGMYLDFIGQLLNVTRSPERRGEVSSSNSNIKFYVTTGVLYDSLNGANYIPEGTIVSNEAGTIFYSVEDTVIVAPSNTEVYVSATSMNQGAEGNIGSNELTVHDIPDVSGILVTNTEAILSGTSTEDDDNFRARIANAILAAQKANITAIEQAVLTISEVADVSIRPYVRGIGTFDVYVLSRSVFPSTSLLAEVQTEIEDVQSYGASGLARSPKKLSVELTIRILFKEGTDVSLREGIKSDVSTAILDYMASIPMGGAFIYNEMIQRVQDVSSAIVDNQVSIYRFRGKDSLKVNILAEFDEMFFPNENINEAIKVI